MRPVLFEIFGRPFYAYGFFMMSGILLGAEVCVHWATQNGYTRKQAWRCLIYTIIGSLVFARVLYVVTNWSDFAPGFPGSMFAWKISGLVAYGGLLGGTFTALGYCLVTRMRFLPFADAAAPTMSFGMGIVRIGCLLAGCDFGVPTDAWWGIQFPHGSFAYNQQLREGLLDTAATASLPVVPTQILESLFGFTFAYGLYRIYRRQVFPGAVIVAFFSGYGVFRFAIEFVRGDEARGTLAGWSTSQFISLLILPVGVLLFWQLYRLYKRRPIPKPWGAQPGNP